MSHDLILPNRDNYHVSSKVEAWVSKKISVGNYSAYLPLGNIIDGTLSPEITKLEHSTNLNGLDAKDAEFVTKVAGRVTLVIDELVRQNLEYILGSSGRTASQSFNYNKWETPTFASGTITINSGATVAAVNAVYSLTGTLYSEGATADYTVNLSTGVITRVAGSTIGATEQVVVYYDVDATGSKYAMFDSPQINGKLQIVDAGGDIGAGRVIQMDNVDISLDGDINVLNKTDFNQATLAFSFNEDSSTGFGSWYNFG